MQPSSTEDPPPTMAAESDTAHGKRSHFKDWWTSLTSHSSSNPDNPAGDTDTPLHHQAYQPKHAGRDALLAIPLAERKKSDGIKVNAYKSQSLDNMSLAIHPNKSLSSTGLSSWGRDKDGRAASWGLWSSPSGSMERIPEDGVANSTAAVNGDGSTALTSRQESWVTAPDRPTIARMGKHFSTSDLLEDMARMDSASGSKTPTDPSGSNSNSNTNTNTSSSLSSAELQLRLQRQQRQIASALIMRQLQERVSPSPSPAAMGVARRPTAVRVTSHPSPLSGQVRKAGKEYFRHRSVARPSFSGMMAQSTAEANAPAGESAFESQQPKELSVAWKGKGKGKAKAVFEETPDQEGSEMPAAINVGWPVPTTFTAAITTTTPTTAQPSTPSVSNNSNSTVRAPHPILPLRQADSQDITQDIAITRERSPSQLQLATAERTQSAETVNSPTDTAFTSDVSRNESNASSATTADEAEEAKVEGKGEKEEGEEEAMGEGEKGEDRVDDDGNDEWGRRVIEAAQAL